MNGRGEAERELDTDPIVLAGAVSRAMPMCSKSSIARRATLLPPHRAWRWHRANEMRGTAPAA
jgi:hypothetical protein